ncbi:MAG: diguanylate cyclase [Thermodesulfobacteriota bacterium]|nr:diguanylate cyclase [Thermodesulfobacteriota bacterium]
MDPDIGQRDCSTIQDSWTIIPLDASSILLPVISEVSSASLEGCVILESGHVVYANDQFLKVAGYDKGHILGMEFIDLISSQDQDGFAKACEDGAGSSDGRFWDCEFMITPFSGRRLNVLIRGGWLEAQERTFLWLIIVDITKTKKMERRLKDETQRFNELFDRSPIGILYLSPRGRIMECNLFVSRITGYSREEIKKSPFTLFVSPGDIEDLESDFKQIYSQDAQIKRECVLITRDSREIVIEYDARLITRKGHKVGSLMLFTDITEKKRLENDLMARNEENERGLWEMAEVKDALESRAGELVRVTEELEMLNEKLNLLSITDGLTNVYNHRYFQERLDDEIERLNRQGKGYGVLSLFMLDIDDFKECNDTYGHQHGDIVLEKMARIIREKVRTIDMVARYGGEEFVVILPHTTMEEAARVALRVNETIRETSFSLERKRNTQTARITVSIGVGGMVYGDSGKSDLVSMADKALYKAKELGKDRVVIGSKDETTGRNKG